jgi:hypothetical protein
MSTTTTPPATDATRLRAGDRPAVEPTPRPVGRARAAALLAVGGLLLSMGGQLHPHGVGDTVAGYLGSMLAGPGWPLSHALLLAGTLLATLGFLDLRRAGGPGAPLRRWLTLAVAGWAVAAVEMVPHLLAVTDADGLERHGATPVLDVHLVLQVLATPALGLTTAALAVAVARSARTWPARLLAVPAVVGGVGYALAGPLVAATGDLHWTVLFPLQAGPALWLVGTGIRLAPRWRRPGRA